MSGTGTIRGAGKQFRPKCGKEKFWGWRGLATHEGGIVADGLHLRGCWQIRECGVESEFGKIGLMLVTMKRTGGQRGAHREKAWRGKECLGQGG